MKHAKSLRGTSKLLYILGVLKFKHENKSNKNLIIRKVNFLNPFTWIVVLLLFTFGCITTTIRSIIGCAKSVIHFLKTSRYEY